MHRVRARTIEVLPKRSAERVDRRRLAQVHLCDREVLDDGAERGAWAAASSRARREGRLPCVEHAAAVSCLAGRLAREIRVENDCLAGQVVPCLSGPQADGHDTCPGVGYHIWIIYGWVKIASAVPIEMPMGLVASWSMLCHLCYISSAQRPDRASHDSTSGWAQESRICSNVV